MHDSLIKEARYLSRKPYYIKKNYLAQKKISFPYVRYRVARPLLKVYNRLLKSGTGRPPWLTPAAIKILDNALTKKMQGLEYGSGNSTYFLCDILGSLTSVEHDKQWHDQIGQLLEENKTTNIKYYLIPPEDQENNRTIEDRNNRPYDEENPNYLTYYELIETFEPNYFDFIIIDGRARVECARRSIDKLRNGGIFVLDNSERIRYRPVHDMLANWEKVNTTTGLTDTTIWFKP